MPPIQFLRRTIATAGFALLTATTVTLAAVAAIPAHADPAEVQLAVSPSTAHPGDTVTVTETITNINNFTVLQPRARLFGTPELLTSFTSLVSCTGAASCTTVDEGDGPIGYQAALPEALDPMTSATVSFTLQIAPDATDLVETLQGQLFGSNYATGLVDGPTLTVDATADAAVGLTATPRLGILVPRLDFAVRVDNGGPGVLRDAEITTTLPPGLSANGSAACVPSPGKVVCTVEELANGAGATVEFSVPLRLLSIGVPYKFTSTLTSSDSVDPNPANNSATRTCTVVTPVLVTCH